MPPIPASAHAPDADGQRLRSELERARARCHELQRQYDDLLRDPAVIQEDRDAAAVVLATARAAVAAAELAVARWNAGAYGRCESCGVEIPTERLEAVPGATRCVACSG